MLATCDHCGPTVRAAVQVSKGEHALSFCGHCHRVYGDKLTREGWTTLDLAVTFA